jgi:SprT-like protein
MLTEYQLKRYADKWLNETYGMKLTVPLKLNGRLKKACGRFVYYKRGDTPRPKTVELNRTFVENNEPAVVLDVLRHELVHYALFMQGKPHSDGQRYFEHELRRLGVVSQGTIDKYTISSKLQIYSCSSCRVEYKLRRRLKNNGINHRCNCGGRLIDMGKRVVAG